MNTGLARSLAAAALLAALLTVPGFGADPAPEPGYPHGDFDGDCATCHSGDAWKPAASWSGSVVPW